MRKQITVDITKIPSGGDIGAGPWIAIVPDPACGSAADLYRQHQAAPAACRASEEAVAIVATGLLNTPDKVAATGWRGDGRNFAMNLEIRRFEGPLAANDPWMALVRMRLGKLAPGWYRLAVRETVRRFMDRHHPERTVDPTTRERSATFVCQ